MQYDGATAVPQAVIYALVAMVSFGATNAITKEISQAFGAVRATIVRSTLIVIFLAIGLAIVRPPLHIDPLWLWLGALIGLGGYLGFISFMLALKSGKVGVVVPVGSSSIVVSSLLGFVVLGDRLTPMKIATVIIVFIGVALASINFRALKQSDIFSWGSGVPFALLTALSWGIALPLFKYPSDRLGSLFYALLVELVVLLSACLQLWITPRFENTYSLRNFSSIMTRRTVIVTVVAALGVALGSVFLNLGYQTGQVSIVAAIFGSQAIIALATGALVYREVLTRQQYIAAALVAAGIALPVLAVIKI